MCLPLRLTHHKWDFSDYRYYLRGAGSGNLGRIMYASLWLAELQPLGVKQQDLSQKDWGIEREAKPTDFSKAFHLVPANVNVLPRRGRRLRSRILSVKDKGLVFHKYWCQGSWSSMLDDKMCQPAQSHLEWDGRPMHAQQPVNFISLTCDAVKDPCYLFL